MNFIQTKIQAKHGKLFFCIISLFWKESFRFMRFPIERSNPAGAASKGGWTDKMAEFRAFNKISLDLNVLMVYNMYVDSQ